MATEMTLAVVERASAAYVTSYLFGQQVQLFGLKNVTMNGKRGVARGFQWDTKRRAVYLFDDNKEMAVKPENIKLVVDDIEQHGISDEATRRAQRILCNIQ